MTITRMLLGMTTTALIFLVSGVYSPARDATAKTESHPKMVSQSSDRCRLASVHYELGDLPSQEIVKMLEQCSKEGDVRGTMWLARLYFKGRCSLPLRAAAAQQMAREIITNVVRMAEGGDCEAQFLVGSAYNEGLGIDQDFSKAVKWYELAASSGHITALNNLGVLTQRAQGTPPDIEKARNFFAQAVKRGSVHAAENMHSVQDDGRDDTERLRRLVSVPLVQALGKQRDDGIAFLVKHGVLTNPRTYIESDHMGDRQLQFKEDGVLLIVDVAGRIMNVEGHAVGQKGSSQYKGAIPMGVAWSDTKDTARKKLGQPDDFGSVSSDGSVYGMAYRTENVFFAVMFGHGDTPTLKVWRVYERWAANYPAQLTNAPYSPPEVGSKR
jgi:Sel1 repeat